MNLQNQREKNISSNLDLSNGIDIRLASFTPEIELVVAWDKAAGLELKEHGLPPPEPAVAD